MGDFYEAFAQPWTHVPEAARRYNEALAREGQQPGTVALDSFAPPVEVDAYEALVRDPSASLRRLADRAARALTPGLYGYLTERAPPPPPPNADLYSPGKMPIDRDPQLEGAWGDVANITSNFVGPSGAAKAAATGGMKWLAMALPPGRRPPGLPMDKASRLARADEMGFHRDVPLYGSTAPEGEQIAAAAVKVGDRVFTGKNHALAIDRAEKAFGNFYWNLPLAPIPEGWVTSSGRYVSRYEADDIAKAAAQLDLAKRRVPPEFGLASEDMRLASAVSHPERGPRIGTTAPGLPGGGGGVWLTMDQAAAPGSIGPLLHRTANPVRWDASGLKLHEIYDTLDAAWKRGHDAVVLKNYTAPDGVVQNVVVVRDANQLRVPKAVFDPAKKLSRDLTAGIVPPIAVSAGAAADANFREAFRP